MHQNVDENISQSFPIIGVYNWRLTNIEHDWSWFILQPFFKLIIESWGLKSTWNWFWIAVLAFGSNQGVKSGRQSADFLVQQDKQSSFKLIMDQCPSLFWPDFQVRPWCKQGPGTMDFSSSLSPSPSRLRCMQYRPYYRASKSASLRVCGHETWKTQTATTWEIPRALWAATGGAARYNQLSLAINHNLFGISGGWSTDSPLPGAAWQLLLLSPLRPFVSVRPQPWVSDWTWSFKFNLNFEIGQCQGASRTAWAMRPRCPGARPDIISSHEQSITNLLTVTQRRPGRSPAARVEQGDLFKFHGRGSRSARLWDRYQQNTMTL